MNKNRNREEAVNTQLAILISSLGVTADAETIHVRGEHRPDVLFQLRGLRVIIEGKFADQSNAESIVLNDARKRVRSGLAHIAAAAIYPIELRTTPTTKLVEALRKSQLTYRIISETHESDDWFEGTPSSLMEALRRAQEALIQDDIVEKTAKALSIQLEGIAALWAGQAGACDRLSTILGISIPKSEKIEQAEERRETSAKVSALVLANALIFQEQLALTDGRIEPLKKLEKEKSLLEATSKHWRWIWEEINYVPIFQLGERVLAELPTTSHTELPLRRLLEESQAICKAQSALRHDLMGRIYHWLLHHAKYLGTYYTSVPAATLLLKLTMAADWKQNFGNPSELAQFRVGDLACGTGTLLMATSQAFLDIYIKQRAADGLSLEAKDLSTLHKALMENMLYGYDVLPSAVHLTASTLALLAPEVAFRKMNLYVMPLGMDQAQARLGSLDFLMGSELRTQMALDYTQLETVRTGVAKSYVAEAKVPKLNLCVMNPPFVRSVGGNLLFGSLPEEERAKLQKELKHIVKTVGANSTAGLGSVFVALADRYLEIGGRLAFVLPAALATGEAWGPTRRLIADKYHLETVIASHDAERPNFSENTSLSEVMFVAVKLTKPEKNLYTKFVNLWRNPRSIHEAIDLANRIERAGEPVKIEAAGITSIRGLSGKTGEIVSLPMSSSEENWTGTLFSQTELLRACWSLQRGELRLPGSSEIHRIPMCRLSELGSLGYDRRDIHDAFEVSTDDWSPYPAFWSHESEKVNCILQKPTANLLARTKAAKGRKLKNANDVWAKAGSILLAERLRTNTHRVVSVGFDKEVLGNTWWAFKSDDLNKQQEEALLLWLNSSLSVLLYFGRRVITEGAWMQMKKPAWNSMPVLDVRALSSKQVGLLSSAFALCAKKPLLPIAQLDHDETRQQIDETLAKVLKIPNVSSLRELLAREPGLTAEQINPSVSDAPDNDDDGQEALL